MAIHTCASSYVIFIGDNGTPMFGGYKNQIDNMYITKTGRGKGTPFESGCRVPMAIRGPNIAAGQQRSTFVHLADLSATILTLAGLEPPETNKDNNNNTVDSDSRSLTPILFGAATTSSRDPDAALAVVDEARRAARCPEEYLDAHVCEIGIWRAAQDGRWQDAWQAASASASAFISSGL